MALLRHQLALASAFRLAHRLPLSNGFDLASAGFTVGAVGAGPGFLQISLLVVACYTQSRTSIIRDMMMRECDRCVKKLIQNGEVNV